MKKPSSAQYFAFLDLSLPNGFSRHAHHVMEFLRRRGIKVEAISLQHAAPDFRAILNLFFRALWLIFSGSGFVILATQANYLQVVLALAAALRGRPLIYDMQDLTPESFGHLYGGRLPGIVLAAGTAWLRFSERIIARLACAILVVSPGMCKVLKARLHRGAPLFLFPNHHSLSILPRPDRTESPPTLVYTGGLQPIYRGLETQLAALEHLPEWHMIIAGEGDQAWLQALIQHHGLEDRVRLLGFVAPAVVRSLLLEGDILVIEGVPYGLPSKFFEAVSAGIVIVSPITASDVNSILGASAVVFAGGADELRVGLARAWQNLGAIRSEQRRSLERFEKTINSELDRLALWLSPKAG